MAASFPIPLAFVVVAALLIGILFGSAFPIFYVFRNELVDEVARHQMAYHNSIETRVIGFLENTAQQIDAMASAMTSIPNYRLIMATIFSALRVSNFAIEYVQIGTPQRQYYALTFSPSEPPGVQWEASYQDPAAGYACRYDFTILPQELPDIKTTSITATRCTYDARTRPWYGELNSSTVVYGKTYPRIGRATPQAYLPVGKRLEDESGRMIGVISANILTNGFRYLVPPNEAQNSFAFLIEVASGYVLGHTDPTLPLFDTSVYDRNATNAIVSFARVSNMTQNPMMAPYADLVADLNAQRTLTSAVEIIRETSAIVYSDVTIAGTHFRVVTVQQNDAAAAGANYSLRVFIIFILLATLLGILMILTGVKLRKATMAIVTLAAKMEKVTAFEDDDHHTLRPGAATRNNHDDLDDNEKLDTVFAEIAQIQDRFLQMKTVLSVSAKYIPKEVITDFLVQGAVGLGMASTNVAMLFIDIEKFTSICERLSGDDLPILLEHYFDIQSRAILRNGGTIDKFIGDAIMCVWGAPSAVGHHNVRALATALRLKDQLELDHNVTRFASLGAHIAVRVGVHGGAVMAGNLGCDRRVAYTVVGHNVVVAGALEAMNKQFGTRISTTDAVLTAGDVPDNTFLTRVLGRVRVNGKPLVVHEVLGVHPHFDLASFSDERVEEAFDDTSSRRSMLTSKAHVTAAVGEADPSRQSSSHAAAARRRRRAAIATVRQVMSETLRSSYMCTELQVRQCVKYREAVQLYQKGAFVACEAAVREYLALVDPEVEHRAAAQLLALCDSHKISPPAMDEWTGELPVGAEK